MSFPRDSRRLTILTEARELFLKAGFSAASMSDIAARAGGSKGTLYNYYASKHELFTEVVRTECELRQGYPFEVRIR